VLITRHPKLILDQQERVIAVLAGQPKDTEGWECVLHGAEAAMDRASQHYKFPMIPNRRGDYQSISTGISFGGGQTEVRNISHGNNQAVVDELKSTPSIMRLAGFMDNAFELYNPRMHQEYRHTMNALCSANRRLKPNFKRNVFGACTFNLGPKVQTKIHTDHLNYAPGWCGIIALGEYDYTKGGHLVLWDLKLVIEFPPGSLIFIPSAILRHSNTTVGDNERRRSFTQFSAGGLFRWVECGFQTQ
ncbi:hypothetical protein C8Q74DRAFT_1175577, partial [Fomes fomentarius]